MFVKQVRLDRFGSWNDASIEGLGPGLHVLQGSGRAAVHFVRSVFFGFNTRSRQGFLPAESRGFGGAITVSTPAGLQTISRYDDGSSDGRLTVEHEDGSLIGRRHVQELLAGVSSATFEQMFAVDFSERPQLRDLIREAQAVGVDVVGGLNSLRVQELCQLLASKRGELRSVPIPSLSLEELRSRRQQLGDEIEDISRQLDSCDLESQQRILEAEIRKLQNAIDDEQRNLRSVERLLHECVAEKRELLKSQDRRGENPSNDGESLQELGRLDQQIERWQSVVLEIVERKQLLQPLVPESDAPLNCSEVRQHLRSLEEQISSLRAGYLEADGDRWQDAQLRGHYSAKLQQLQEMVYRICRELSESESRVREITWSREMAQLTRCERELKAAIHNLSLRRRQLLARLPQTEVQISQPEHVEFCRCHSHPRTQDSPSIDCVPANGRVVQLEFEITDAERRRDNAIKTLDELDGELVEVRARLANLNDFGYRELVVRLETCREQFDRVEQELQHAQLRHELVVATEQLEQEIERFEARTSSSVVEQANASLRRVSGGDFDNLEIVGHEAFVRDEHNRRVEWTTLADGARDQVYLALSLAIVSELHRRGVQLPVVLHAAFTHMESGDIPEAAEVIRDFSRQSPQVLICTRHEHVVDVFRLCNASVHEISVQVSAAPLPSLQMPVELEGGDWDAEESPDRPEVSWPHPSSVQTTPPADLAPFHLSEDCPIEDTPSLDEANAVRFRKIGVMTVGDLLNLAPAAAAESLKYAGISEEQIRSWQAQASLVCRVPHLRPYDARILVACGVTDVDQLSRMQPAQVREIVQRFANSSRGQAVLMSGTEFELSRVTEWIKESQRSNGRTQASGHRTNSRHPSSARRTSTSNRSLGQPAGTNVHTSVLKIDRSSGWKFYLETNDPIGEAPSIGPRTAERLDAAGINTVADLLRADADELAQRLQHNRTNADTIRQWQQQTSLVCRVPQLRGHDAQILVALGITDPTELAGQKPEELWDKVAPFVATNQGKRIIRNGKTPDLAEMADWIHWAGAARTLSAA